MAGPDNQDLWGPANTDKIAASTLGYVQGFGKHLFYSCIHISQRLYSSLYKDGPLRIWSTCSFRRVCLHLPEGKSLNKIQTPKGLSSVNYWALLIFFQILSQICSFQHCSLKGGLREGAWGLGRSAGKGRWGFCRVTRLRSLAHRWHPRDAVWHRKLLVGPHPWLWLSADAILAADSDLGRALSYSRKVPHFPLPFDSLELY